MKINKANMMKGFAFLLLAAMLQGSFCFVLCESGIQVCCHENKSEKHEEHKSCCDKKEHDEKENGCAKEHFAFFKTFTKFHSNGGLILTKVFQPNFSISYAQLIIHTTTGQHNFSAYNCFHPPPLLDDVCILNHRFRI